MSQPNLDPNNIEPRKFELRKSLLNVLRPKKEKKEKAEPIKKKTSRLLDTLKVVIAALFIAFVIRAFFMQISYVPTDSMRPMLNAGDWVVVNKTVYGITNPFQAAGRTGKLPRYITRSSRKPKRMDVALFKGPVKYGNVIGRIIGLPGDTVKIKKGTVYVNGIKVNEKLSVNKDRSDLKQIKISADKYFILGDNRAVQADSRRWGTVPRDNMIGVLTARIWPLNKARTFR
jgi:signal peptidase I